MKNKIKKKLKKITWLDYPGSRHGHSNGYVGVPKEHPWFKEFYDDIPVEIHGGLTFSEFDDKKGFGLWWVGFDTAHYGDNPDNWNEQDCKIELERLYEQAIAACSEDTK